MLKYANNSDFVHILKNSYFLASSIEKMNLGHQKYA